METMLITGGAGFIGSNFVRLALAETTASLVIVDKLTYAGSLNNLEDVLQNPRVRFSGPILPSSPRWRNYSRRIGRSPW